MNKPVAWMNRLGRLEYEQGNGFEIPLYTHPVKEKGLSLNSPSPMNQACLTSEDNYITDEEIAVIWANYAVPMTGIEFIKVARAILRKAQEK